MTMVHLIPVGQLRMATDQFKVLVPKSTRAKMAVFRLIDSTSLKAEALLALSSICPCGSAKSNEMFKVLLIRLIQAIHKDS
jgi:hypothetical protein